MSDEKLTPEQELNKLIESSPYKNNELIEHEKEIINLLVYSWNSIIGDYENKTIKWSMKVQEICKGYPDKTIKDVMDKIRNHPDLKSPMHSKDRIYAGLRLVKTKPKLVEWINMTPEQRKLVPEDDAPYHKDNATLELQTEFYLTMGKWALDPGLEWELEQKAKKEKWSYRKLMKEVQILRMEKAEPNTMRRLQKQSLIREMCFMMKDLQPEELRGIKNFVIHNYKEKLVSWNRFQESIWKDEKESELNGVERRVGSQEREGTNGVHDKKEVS